VNRHLRQPTLQQVVAQLGEHLRLRTVDLDGIGRDLPCLQQTPPGLEFAYPKIGGAFLCPKMSMKQACVPLANDGRESVETV